MRFYFLDEDLCETCIKHKVSRIGEFDASPDVREITQDVLKDRGEDFVVCQACLKVELGENLSL